MRHDVASVLGNNPRSLVCSNARDALSHLTRSYCKSSSLFTLLWKVSRNRKLTRSVHMDWTGPVQLQLLLWSSTSSYSSAGYRQPRRGAHTRAVCVGSILRPCTCSGSTNSAICCLVSAVQETNRSLFIFRIDPLSTRILYRLRNACLVFCVVLRVWFHFYAEYRRMKPR